MPALLSERASGCRDVEIRHADWHDDAHAAGEVRFEHLTGFTAIEARDDSLLIVEATVPEG
jgi:hypothetical protein